jgi:hypothetical protein
MAARRLLIGVPECSTTAMRVVFRRHKRDVGGASVTRVVFRSCVLSSSSDGVRFTCCEAPNDRDLRLRYIFEDGRDANVGPRLVPTT